jgi:quercetin dioxygenase-like cupin family protein
MVSKVTDLDISHFFGGGVYIKETRIPSGYTLVQHKHSFDHLAVLASGTAILRVDGVPNLVTGPAVLKIEAEKNHGVRAVTACRWLCVWATEETDPAKVDGAVIAKDSDLEAMEEIGRSMA